MILKKKKLLNVKYKRRSDSARLLDKQFSISQRGNFKINIKGLNYYFQKTSNDEIYKVKTQGISDSKSISIGGNVNLKHKDKTNIFFDFYEDFLYELPYGLYSYFAISFMLCLMFISAAGMIAGGESEVKPMAKEEIVAQDNEKRLKSLLKKLVKQKKIVVKKKKVIAKPKPKIKKVAKKKIITPKRKPIVKRVRKTRSMALKKTTRPNPSRKGSVKRVNDKRKMKRLVVTKGPSRRGGTGPKNPNAKGNSARRSQAVKLAQTKAKMATALNGLFAGKGALNIPSGSKGGRGYSRGGGGGIAGAKNIRGKNFLAKVTGKNVIGSSNGAINTNGSRTLASGSALSDGEINGIAGGRSLNYVQGKVSVKGLHAAGGSGGLGSFGVQKMSVKGNMDQRLVRKVIQQNMSKFVYCYEKAMLKNTSLQGIVSLTWTIKRGGRATKTRVSKSQLNDRGLHGCLVGVMNKLNFAPGPKGGDAVVTYPFNFTSSML